MSELMQFRRVREPTDDGYVYGMCLAYFTDEDYPALISWEPPYWTEQSSSDFSVSLDLLESEWNKDGSMAFWAVHLPVSYPDALKLMRHATTEPCVDAEKYWVVMGE